MTDDMPPYKLEIFVADDAGNIFAELRINHGHLDTACAAFGHATEAANKFHRDRRLQRESLETAEAEKTAILNAQKSA